MDDREIVTLYLQRSEQAATEAERKYVGYCQSIALHILPIWEDAQECVQDAFLAAWESIPPNEPENLRTYLGKLTRRAAVKQWRDSHRQKRGGDTVSLALEELDGCLRADTCVESELTVKELTAHIQQFLARLPQTERNVFLCRYWYLDTTEAIGKRYGFSVSKVKSMLFRTRKRLRTYLQKEGLL